MDFYIYNTFKISMNCPCCGFKMEATHTDNLTVFKCNSCGLSNTELKKEIR
jgi:transposase